MDPVSGAIIFGIAAGGLSAQAAGEQNKNAREQAELNKLSLDASTEAQLNESARAFRTSMGSNQAAAASRGVASSQDLGLGILGAFLGNESNIMLNQLMGNAQIDSQRAAQSVNPLTSILSGVLGGVQTGASVGSAFQQGAYAKDMQQAQKTNALMRSFVANPSALNSLLSGPTAWGR